MHNEASLTCRVSSHGLYALWRKASEATLDFISFQLNGIVCIGYCPNIKKDAQNYRTIT